MVWTKKTNFPSLENITKDEQQVIGMKIHGIETFAFICDEFARKGANLICEIFRSTLSDLDTSNKLPVDRPVLYLLVDTAEKIRTNI